MTCGDSSALRVSDQRAAVQLRSANIPGTTSSRVIGLCSPAHLPPPPPPPPPPAGRGEHRPTERRAPSAESREPRAESREPNQECKVETGGRSRRRALADYRKRWPRWELRYARFRAREPCANREGVPSTDRGESRKCGADEQFMATSLSASTGFILQSETE